MADPSDTLAISYHEAGHAIAARQLGIKVTRVLIGEITFGHHNPGPMTDWNFAVVMVAGPAAEIRYSGLSPEQIKREWVQHWHTDRRNAERGKMRPCRHAGYIHGVASRADHIGGGPKQRTGGLSGVFLCQRGRAARTMAPSLLQRINGAPACQS
jgi:hypothetical protein